MPTDDGLTGAAARAGAILTIDLEAIAENYRRLRARLGNTPCAAVVKANGYGLGIEKVAPVLAAAGARGFFVAQLDEAIRLRAVLSAPCPDAEIYVLNGLMRGAEPEYLAHRLRPVLNSPDDLARWSARGRQRNKRLPAALHVDTGMCRLGLSPQELDALADDPSRLEAVGLALVMSHLACADEPSHPLNRRQRDDFAGACRRLPPAPASLANSSGIFLGADFHFDLGRPGVALYGINPTPGAPNPMRQVVFLQGKILQLRDVDAPQSVGYGASHRVTGPMRLATVGVGYADGYLRSLSSRGRAYIGGQEVAVVGRVSMDLITLDVTDVPDDLAKPGALIDLFHPEQGPDPLAAQAGTIGYELLTDLGRRYHRIYRGA